MLIQHQLGKIFVNKLLQTIVHFKLTESWVNRLYYSKVFRRKLKLLQLNYFIQVLKVFLQNFDQLKKKTLRIQTWSKCNSTFVIGTNKIAWKGSIIIYFRLTVLNLSKKIRRWRTFRGWEYLKQFVTGIAWTAQIL